MASKLLPVCSRMRKPRVLAAADFLPAPRERIMLFGMDAKRRSVFQLGPVDFGIETAALPNGVSLELPIIRHPGAAAILALDENDKIVMLSQYRHAVGGYLWEVPAGCRRPAESSVECARRELLEETGLRAESWRLLGAIVTVPSFCDERIDIYLARDLRAGVSQHDADEVIKVERIAVSRVLEMVQRGEIVDAKTIVALHHFNRLAA